MNFWLNILADFGIYVILALSLNVICGLTGLLQLGHAGFFAVGAYAAGLLAIYSYPATCFLGAGNLVLGCLAAAGAAAVLAALIGLPCLRLRGDYLAIASLGFGEIVRHVLNNVEFPICAFADRPPLGLAKGISLVSTVSGVTYVANYASWWVILIAAALTYLLMLNVKRSYLGRAMMCIREDEIAARTMGVNVPGVKMTAFLLGAVVAGIAGALFVHNPYSGLRAAPGTFDLLKTVEILLIVVLGGLGSMTGSLVAAALLAFLPQLLRFLPTVAGIQLAQHKQLLYALLLIVLIRLVPNGLLGLHECPAALWQLLRRRPAP
ncbi:MAG: branched-chain amino acid ABC transporter permease [Planctomycetota bacterium]|nr:branched-chain amino acid ABC transporter permease [Planctomycetota bacterium]